MADRVKADRVSEEERRELVREFESSGSSVAEFSWRHGLSSSTFWTWSKKYASDSGQRSRSAKKARPSGRRARSKDSPSSRALVALAFAEVVVGPCAPSGRSPVVVHLPLGVRVEVPAELVEAGIRRLLREEPRC